MNCHSSGLPRSTWHFCHAQQRMVHFKKRQAFQCFRSFSSLKIRLSLWVLTFLGLFLGWHEAFATCWSSRLQQHWGWDTETLVMLGALWRFFGGYPGNPTQKSSIQPCWNAEYDPVTSAIFTPCLPCISMQRNCYDWRWCSAYMSGELPCLFGEEHEKSCYLQQNALCFIGLRHTATPHARVDVCCFTSEQLVVEIDGDWYLQYELQNGYENAIELHWNIISNFTRGFNYHVLLEFAT